MTLGLVFAVLFGISEALAQIPSVRANSIYQSVANFLSVFAPRKL